MTRKPLEISVLSLSIFACLAVSVRAARPVSTLEERQHAVQVTRALEEQPASDDANDTRLRLVMWYGTISDIKVPVCDLLGPKPHGEHLIYAQLVLQQMLGAGAFMIEHPDQAKDLAATQTGGLLSALRVYESFSKLSPQARLAYVDGLLKKRDGGALQGYVADSVQKQKHCN